MRISAISNIRLESYLFTQEAFAVARARLKPGGLFVLYNQYRWPWLVNKIAATAEDVFGAPPVIVQDGVTTVIVAGGPASGAIVDRSGFERLASDDWPFVYMKEPAVHWLYIGMIVMFLGVSILAVRVLAPAGTLARPEYSFFFRLFGDSCGSFSLTFRPLERGKHGGEDLEPEVLLVA